MKKLFVVGCPRSGTTLLQQALNRHSQIVIPPETKLFYYLYGQTAACQRRHVQRLNRDLGICLPAAMASIRTPDEARACYAEIARQYLQRLNRGGVTYFGDKTPEHTGHWPQIREVFPDAKLIVLHRDGRDVAVSLSKMPWIRCDVYAGFVIWLYYQRILRTLRECSSLDVYHVRYEDLVARPDVELAGVLRFLGLPYERQVAEGSGNREGIPQREYAWKGRAIEKISSERVGTWRRELSREQVSRLERLGRQALRDLGYELSNPDAGRLPVWFLGRLTWSVARCALHLPLDCLFKELGGLASRFAPRRWAAKREQTGTFVSKQWQTVHSQDYV